MGGIVSRIFRYFFGIAVVHGSRNNSCRKTKRSFHIKSSNEDKQAAKAIEYNNTLLDNKHSISATTGSNRLGPLAMRRRSFHTSAICMKGNSMDILDIEMLDNNNVPAREVKPGRMAKRVGVTTIMREYLELGKKPDQKHYNIIKTIADPHFLVACYEEIMGKPGNMTRGSDKETLDGLNWA